MKIVAYIRVSTARQGSSGLGIEAQRAEIAAYAAAQNATITAEYIEVESGKKNDRPALERAIREARLIGSKLVIARRYNKLLIWKKGLVQESEHPRTKNHWCDDEPFKAV